MREKETFQYFSQEQNPEVARKMAQTEKPYRKIAAMMPGEIGAESIINKGEEKAEEAGKKMRLELLEAEKLIKNGELERVTLFEKKGNVIVMEAIIKGHTISAEVETVTHIVGKPKRPHTLFSRIIKLEINGKPVNNVEEEGEFILKPYFKLILDRRIEANQEK